MIKFETNDKQTTCYITYNGITVSGTAKCHPDDEDMLSERTGCNIAEQRATIELLKLIRKIEIDPVVKELKHLKFCIENNPNYKCNSYEHRIVCKQLYRALMKLEMNKEDIRNKKAALKEYIEVKERLYQRIRKGKKD